MENFRLEKTDEVRVNKLLNNYLYYTSNDVERDEEGLQCLIDAVDFIKDEYGVSSTQARQKVDEVLNKIR